MEAMMRKTLFTSSVLLAALFALGRIPAQSAVETKSATPDLDRRFDALLDPAEMGAWMKTMTA
jgi:hypothetical protein